jgi:transposase
MRVGIEATGSMQWFVNLMEEVEIECLVGHPAQIRAAEPRKQKHDRRDADLILELLVQDRFPAIWLPNEDIVSGWTVGTLCAFCWQQADGYHRAA